jgi:hypothetical protein
MEELERRAAVSSVSSDSGSDSAGSGYESEGSMSAMRRRPRNSGDRGFQDLLTRFKTRYLLALLYLGSRSLRMPVLTADFVKWANNGDIPYFFTEKLIGDSLSQGYNMNRLGMDKKVSFLF